MKNLLLAVTACTLFAFASCKKEDGASATGSIRYTNKSVDSFSLFLDGNWIGDVSSYGERLAPNVATGTHSARAIQKNYPIKPQVIEMSLEVRKDAESSFKFP